MNGQIEVVVNQIIVFGILMVIGFIAVKVKVLTRDGLDNLSTLIVKIILPGLVFSLVAGSGVTIEEFLISGRFAVGVILCFTILIIAGIIISKLCRFQEKTANIFIILGTFGNMGFIGIPLIQEIFKDPVAQVCISVYAIIDTTLFWTFGVYLCGRHQKELNPLSTVKNMVNPTTVALFIAFIVMAFKIPVPELLMGTITGIGGTSKYLALMYLGGSLAFVSVNRLVKKPTILMLVLVKMLIIPVLVNILLSFFLPEIPKTILTLIVALPAMTAVTMVAKTYGADDEYATEVIFVTTLFSLVTIPAVSAVTSIL